MLYSIALFLHVLGALGMFIALGVEWTSLRNLPNATNAREARGWLGLFLLLRRIYPLSFFTILVSGVYMMAVAWGGAAYVFLLAPLVVVAGASLNGGPFLAYVNFPPDRVSLDWYLRIPPQHFRAIATSLGLAAIVAKRKELLP